MPYINEEEQNNAPLWILLVAVATVFVIAHITNIKKQNNSHANIARDSGTFTKGK